MITFNNNYFTMNTKNSTYVMKVDPYGKLLHMYYGRPAEGEMEYVLNLGDRGFIGNLADTGADRTYSMDALMIEYPECGVADFRSPAINVKYEDTSWGTDLRFTDYKISHGKYSLRGLPAVYSNGDDDAETLEIVMEDKVSGVQVSLLYGVIPQIDIITRAVVVKNNSDKQFNITKCQSASLDFPGTGDYDFIKFHGRHCMERNMERTKVGHSAQIIGSRRGTSSHQYSPLMVLAASETTEEYGSCYAMEFVYSGGFKGEVEKDQFNMTRMQIGLTDENFSYPLLPGEEFTAPEVIMSYSSMGLSKLSQNLHKCIRNNVCRGQYKKVLRPVLVNSWEGCYFDFSAENIVSLAKEASALGLDLVVMDDGWFGSRNDDNSGLGDWVTNEKKLGCSLKELAERVNAEGVKFGIWFEPEMVNEDSDLYRNHPDYALCFKGRKATRGRNQLVLNYSRPEVVDAIFNQVCAIVDSANIEYIKWDFNRSVNDVYTEGAIDQGKVMYDYYLGLYSFLERLTAKYPHILIEGCSGGGGRFDAGMMYYTPQIWCSDNTDAIDRIKIQYGTSFGYPVSTWGSHVSAVPNHQTGRITPIKTRATVAMTGTFGYELDLAKLTDEEKSEVKKQIADYKKYALLISDGDYYRLTNPFESEVAAWAVVSEDKKEALVFAVEQEVHGNACPSFIKVNGLMENAVYVDTENDMKYSSGLLKEVGLRLPCTPYMMGATYNSYVWHLVIK